MSSLRKFLPSVTDNSVGSLLFSDVLPSNNWILCDGSLISQATYSDLYSKIGLLPSAQFNGSSTWTLRTSPGVGGALTGANLSALAYNPDASTTNGAVYIYGGTKGDAGAGGSLATSTNGITWTARNLINDEEVKALAYGAGIYVYAQINGRIATSTNGTTWTARTSGTTSDVLDLHYRADATGTEAAWIYGGVGGALRTSTNAITWTAGTPNTATTINSVIYGGGIYVYGQNGGRLSTSTNGITWTGRTSGTSSNINALIYAGGIYVYAGAGGVLATSTDAITWTARTSGTSSILRALYYNENSYIYGGAGGVLATSTDAITWSPLIPAINNGVTHIVSNNSSPATYVYVGNTNGGEANHLATAVKYAYNPATDFLLPNFSSANIITRSVATNTAIFQSQLYIKAR